MFSEGLNVSPTKGSLPLLPTMTLGNSSTSPEGLVPQVENATYHSTKLEKSTLKYLALATSQKLLTEVPTCSILALPTMFGR